MFGFAEITFLDLEIAVVQAQRQVLCHLSLLMLDLTQSPEVAMAKIDVAETVVSVTSAR